MAGERKSLLQASQGIIRYFLTCFNCVLACLSLIDILNSNYPKSPKIVYYNQVSAPPVRCTDYGGCPNSATDIVNLSGQYAFEGCN